MKFVPTQKADYRSGKELTCKSFAMVLGKGGNHDGNKARPNLGKAVMHPMSVTPSRRFVDGV